MSSNKEPGIYPEWQQEPNDEVVLWIEHVDEYGVVREFSCSREEAATLAKFLLMSPLVNAGLEE